MCGMQNVRNRSRSGPSCVSAGGPCLAALMLAQVKLVQQSNNVPGTRDRSGQGPAMLARD